MSMSPLIYNCSYLWKIHTTIPSFRRDAFPPCAWNRCLRTPIRAGKCLAAANTAMRYALSRYIVTRAVSSLTFEAPVLVGDVVSFYTEIIKVGRTSVTVKVEVYAERLTKLCNNIAKITEAELVYVALGADKKPITLKSPAPSSRSAAPLKRGTAFPVPEQRRGPRSRASGRFFPSAGDALVFIHQGKDEGAGRGNGADGDEGGVEGGFHGLSGGG